MTFPLFLHPANRDDEGVSRFHHRVTSDPVADRTISATIPTLGDVPVAELLARLRNGDQGALTTIYDALFPALWRIARLQTQSSHTAEDIVHDVFLWLWMHRDEIDQSVNLRVYLTAATRNRARDLARRHQVANRTAATLDASDMSSSASVETTLEHAEFTQAYRRALTLLSERELTAALLRWEDGFTLEHIGQVLGVSPRGAKGIVERAQTKLYEALKAFR